MERSMSTVFSELTKSIKNFDGDTNTNVVSQLHYPKLIIIRNYSMITVVDLKDKEKTDIHYKLNQKIKDTVLLENLLWIILDSGEIIVLDLDTPYQIKIDNDNYKFWRFLKNDTNLILISESRECFKPLYSSTDIFKKIEDKLSILPASFEKVPKQYSLQKVKNNEVINWNGFNISTETDSVAFKCITTGISEFIYVNGSFEHAVPWGPYFVLSDNLNRMWLTDLINLNVIYKFSDGEGKYYPVAENNNIFYYLTWSVDEIRVCSAWIATSSNIEAFGNLNTKSFTDGPLSQKCLKSHLEYLIETESEAEPFQLLIKIKHFFDCIEDISYLIEIAVQLCKTNISFKSLLFKIQKRAYTVESNCESHITKNIRDILIKIELLEYISFRGSNAYEKIDFFRKNFVELCVTFLTESDLDLATICMLKYLNNNLSLTYDEVTEILNSIPYNIKMSAITVWLKSFVPPLLEMNPYYVDLFVKWTMERVFRLEQSSYWPKIGLKFVDEIMTVLKLSLKNIPIRPMSMDELDKLRYHIDHIIELKEKYKINVLLDELSSLSPREIALIMLRRCYTEDLDGFLKKYLPSFVSRHVLGLDDILFSYIEIEAASSGGVVDSCRLEMLLNSFCSNTSRLDCLLRVLRVLDVPWDSTMLDLAVSAGASINKDYTVADDDKLLAQEIQRELNYSKVKVVLKKYYFPLTCVDYKLVLHKIINAPIIDLNDLKVLINVMSSYSAYAYMMYLNRCLQDCQTRKALEFFNELNHKENKVILKTMLFKFEQIIEQRLCSAAVEKNYLDFLKGSLINDAKMNAIESLYYLKNSYNVTLNLNEIFSENFCGKEPNLITSTSSRSTASLGQGRCVTLLTNSNQSRQSRLLEMLRRTSIAPNVRKHVEAFITSYPSTEKELYSNITPVLTHFIDGYNTSDLLESYSVLVELIVNCIEEDLHLIVKCTSVLNSLIKSNIIMKNLSMTWKFHYIYLSISSIKALNYLIGFYANTPFEQNSRKEILDICNRCDITAFRMITDITEYYTSRKLTEELHEFKDKVLKRIMSKVIGFQDIDEILLTNLLLIFNVIDEENCKEWIIDAASGQNDFLPPTITRYFSSASVRRMFSLDNIFKSNGHISQPQYILKTKFNMNLADIAIPDITEETWDVKVVLFYALKLYPNTNFERLLDLCRTLNVSIDYGLSLQLISLLSTWELKYKFFNDDLGCRQIYIKSNKEDLLSKALVIWESIKNKEFVKDVLNEFWKSGETSLHGRLVSINPYYYEVYFCIYHLLNRLSTESRNVKEYLLLNFLVDYERKTSPEQYEFELFSVKGSFPEIGHYRLPFILFMRDDIWNNLKTEITLETYERWLPVISLVDIKVQNNTDLICANALKQTMTLLKRSEGINLIPKTNEPWRLTAQGEPLLRAAHKCAKYITSMEWAGACLFYVLQGCARGADQVNASKLCYQFAQRWAAIQPVNRVVRQMEHFHLTLSTQHALQKVDWACDEFISLITEPSQLIRSLYVHPDFVEKMMRHDINRAANEIADTNGINVSSIRFQILESILDKSDKETKTKNVSCLNNKELMTAKYILRATCSKMGAIYLSRIAFDDDSEFNKIKKLRALQCLMSIVDTDTAVKVTNRERETLWSSLLELSHVIKLENIDMPWIVATFRQDKVRATEQLLQTVGSNVAGLKIAAELALKYGDESIIRNLIPLLLRASLYEQTVALLMKSSTPPDEMLRSAWHTIILYPFQRADYPITERQRENCLNVINLLPVCPVIRDEDLIEMWKHCLRFKCIGLGCLVLPYMTQKARNSLTELHKIDKRSLIASLKNLHSESYLVSSAMCVVESLPLKVFRKQP